MTAEETQALIKEKTGLIGSIWPLYGKDTFVMPFRTPAAIAEAIKVVEAKTGLKLSTIYLEFCERDYI